MKHLVVLGLVLVASALVYAEDATISPSTPPPAPGMQKAQRPNGERMKEMQARRGQMQEHRKEMAEKREMRREEALKRIDEHLARIDERMAKMDEMKAKMNEMKSKLLEHKARIEKMEAGKSVDVGGMFPPEREEMHGAPGMGSPRAGNPGMRKGPANPPTAPTAK